MPERSRFAYADPPYAGQAKAHYGKNGDPFTGDVAEVDSAALVARLTDGSYAGWALSCSVGQLRSLLPVCPPEVHVAAWVKPWAYWKPNVWPARAWEPVIIKPKGRPSWAGSATTPRDWVEANAGEDNGKPGIPIGFSGAKPRRFCVWLFQALGMEPGNVLDDLYPGTGAVTRAYAAWSGQMRLEVPP